MTTNETSYEQDYTEKETEETEPSKTHGHSNETNDGNTENRTQPQRRKSVVKIGRKTSRVSISSNTKKKTSVTAAPSYKPTPTKTEETPNEEKHVETEDNDEEEKKKRRRNKNASSDILNVIDWKRGEAEEYQGSETVPEVKDIDYTTKTLEKTDKEKSTENNDNNENNKPISNGFNDDDNQTNNKTVPMTNGFSKYDKYLANDDLDKPISDKEVEDSLNYLKNLPKIDDIGKSSDSSVIDNLMDSYLTENPTPVVPTKQRTASSSSSVAKSRTGSTSSNAHRRRLSSDYEKLDELERNLENIRAKKKQSIPPIRNKPSESGLKAWEDPMEQQRVKQKEKQWPPREEPRDAGAYIVESYGQTDPYSKKLIKDIQKEKREEEDKLAAEKRAEVVQDNVQPVSNLKSIFTTQPSRPRPGVQKPESVIDEEKSWIKHEKKAVEFDAPPDEPDWMTLIRNRRWKSTVKARFPCRDKDKTDFDRRSTTPKNWKRLAKDKTAMRMLTEIIGVGAEGEELFSRLASQRQKIDDEQETIDHIAEEELMAYEVARESLGEDAAYSLQMDNPLPAARMRQIIQGPASVREGSISDDQSGISAANLSTSSYPFTTSQLEAAYLTNQLLRLHPEEFRKLMSLERSRQATLRWQFSSDPFDSVHEHQTLPFEIALLASEEPRVQQAMKKILAQGQGEDYRSVFSGSSTPVPLIRGRAMTDPRGYYPDSDIDGYESSQSSGSGIARGRPKKKKVPPPTRPRLRSASPSMMKGMRQDSSENYVPGPTLTVPRLNVGNAKQQLDDDREVHSHGLLTDEELALSEEIAQLQALTSNIGRDIDEELNGIVSSLNDTGSAYVKDSGADSIDLKEIAARRKQFIDKDLENQSDSGVQEGVPKPRHKVRRIQSATQLDAVFGGRRKMSESTEDNQDQNNNQVNQDKEEDKSTSNEMANLISDINTTFGNEA